MTRHIPLLKIASKRFSSHFLRHSPLVIRHFFPSPSSHSPFEGSQRQLGMCTTIAEYVRRGRFVSFSSLSPFGGSGAYRINDSPQIPPLKVASDSWVCVKGDVSLFFPSYSPYCLWPKAYHLFLFLSSRNPLFTIFSLVVLYY
ncbi:hypothetical protein Coch_0848 [Capnocytophaga ochracea DSM 7271]|uniref:Uncharacterized protein n=1 Tax=Capnocytophaga ochracea (strain ATCC 27872 / DSM 7271 / CCUG 9716 / JCM 12966 / NCTC 12371 / SS31 / VPI 2845) TaxID=521097 RepID=C7M958_CAPOD|nr:hypothetical protein Coch_0848 [Capnocytophaga ochracea DSM 7271]